MARLWPFKRREAKSVRKPAERISDLRIVTHDFALINGEAEFFETPRRTK